MSAHLGPAVTALVDGELDHEQREQVLAHLAHCSGCRVEVEVLRTVKATLRVAEPRLPAGLADRLAAAAAGPPPAPARRPMASQPRRTATRRAAVGGAAVALGIAGAVIIAGPPPRGPVAPVDPTSSHFVVDHRSTGGEMPFADVGVTTASLR